MRNTPAGRGSAEWNSIRCYKCGKGGHYANECPDHGGPKPPGQQLYATRVIVNDNDGQVAHSNEQPQEYEEHAVQLRAMSPVDAYEGDDELVDYVELEESEEDPLEEDPIIEEDEEDPTVLMNNLQLQEDFEDEVFDTPVVARVVSRTPSPVFMGTMTTNKEDK